MFLRSSSGSEKRAITLLTLCASTLLSVSATAAEYKLTINKDQNPSNVIVFKDNMSATVTHTAEGMELTIPGVTVDLKCETIPEGEAEEGEAEGANGDKCEITVASLPPPVVPVAPVVPVNPVVPVTPEVPVTPGDPDTPAPAVNSGDFNFGSAGGAATGNWEAITLEPTGILALPFSVKVGNYSGNVGFVPTSKGVPTDGSQIRMWFSSTAGGPSLENFFCSTNGGFQGSLKWTQGSERGKCPIPNQAAEMFLNLRLCNSIRTDRSCNDPKVENGTEAATVYIQGNQTE